MIHENAVTDFCPKAFSPQIQSSAFVHPLAAVIGHVLIGRLVFVGPFASIRGDEGHPLHVGDEANVQDGVVIHALQTETRGESIENNLVTVAGKNYALYIGTGYLWPTRPRSMALPLWVKGPSWE